MGIKEAVGFHIAAVDVGVNFNTTRQFWAWLVCASFGLSAKIDVEPDALEGYI